MTLQEYILSDVLPRVRCDHAQKPRTVDFYERQYVAICAWGRLSGAELGDVTAGLIAAYAVYERSINKLMPATVNRRLAALSKCLRWAEESALIAKVPRVKLLKGERRREYVLTGDVRREFVKGLAEPCRTAAEFYMETGLRTSELCRLVWADINAVEGEVWVTVREGKSEMSRRVLPLTERAARLVTAQGEAQLRLGRVLSADQPVFQFNGGKVSRFTLSHQWRARVREFRDKDGRELPWDAVLYATRHTALTDLAAGGASAFVVQKAAGHASVTTSQRYVHVGQEELRQAYSRKKKSA